MIYNKHNLHLSQANITVISFFPKPVTTMRESTPPINVFYSSIFNHQFSQITKRVYHNQHTIMSFLPPDFMFQSHEHDQNFSSIGNQLLKRSMSYSGRYDQEVMMNEDDDLSDDGSQAGERKKIRLNLEQVKALEKSFELGNKLEPERKMQLAKALNMQPRQVAIWFQNRRARWKTKQLERDYDNLKKQFDAIKVDNGALKAQNKKLHAELMALRSGEPMGRGATDIKRETNQGSWSNGSENSCDRVNLNNSLPSQLSFKQLFPSSFKHTASIAQQQDLQCPKLDQIVQDEGFCNMFGGVDDQSGLWPWPEQHQFQ